MKDTIKTNERIFQVWTFEDNCYLCNVEDFEISRGELIVNNESIRTVKHYWNHKLQRIGKKEVKQIILANRK